MMHRLFSIFSHSGWHQMRRHQRNSIAPCRPADTPNHVHRSSTLQSAVRLACTGVLLVLFSGSVARAQAPDPSDIAEGGRLFRQKANCQACHGWAGDGRKLDSQMPDGANLRETKLDRDAVVMTIKCGIPGAGMPPFDKFAYTDGRCYGLKKADLAKSGQTLSDPPDTLQVREINMLVDFLYAKII